MLEVVNETKSVEKINSKSDEARLSEQRSEESQEVDDSCISSHRSSIREINEEINKKLSA